MRTPCGWRIIISEGGRPAPPCWSANKRSAAGSQPAGAYSTDADQAYERGKGQTPLSPLRAFLRGTLGGNGTVNPYNL